MVDRKIGFISQLEEIMTGLPFEKCTFVTESITGDKGWYAPKGYAFKISGQFILGCDQSLGNWDVVIPSASVDLLKENNEEPSEEVGTPPTEFTGKWLYIDIYERGVQLYVKQNKNFYFENGKGWLTEIDGYYFSTQGVPEMNSVEWEQNYAQGMIGFCSIELVECEEQEPQLYTPLENHTEDSLTLPSISKKYSI